MICLQSDQQAAGICCTSFLESSISNHFDTILSVQSEFHDSSPDSWIPFEDQQQLIHRRLIPLLCWLYWKFGHKGRLISFTIIFFLHYLIFLFSATFQTMKNQPNCPVSMSFFLRLGWRFWERLLRSHLLLRRRLTLIYRIWVRYQDGRWNLCWHCSWNNLWYHPCVLCHLRFILNGSPWRINLSIWQLWGNAPAAKQFLRGPHLPDLSWQTLHFVKNAEL